MTNLAILPARCVLAVSGPDRVAFLQGLVSNDVAEARPGIAIWAALLTPQGKWLADFFILDDGARLLLDCEVGQREMIQQRLTRYRLRSQVTLAPLVDIVHVAWGGGPDEGGRDEGGRDDGGPGEGRLAARDTRLPEAGWRVLSPEPLETNATASDWDAYRLSLGLPDGSRDLEFEKSVLLEAGFDELHGVSWTKGCYMGQELTARTKYRGLLKRRLVPVEIAGPPLAPGTPLLLDGRDVGVMRSAQGTAGMAVVRLEALDQVLTHEATTITPRVPGWMRVAAKS